MNTKLTPIEKRTAAVQAIIDAAIPVPTARIVLIKRNDLIKRIYDLGKMGRSQEWINSLMNWMEVIVAVQDEYLRWAVLEYGIRCQNR
jgi:hypothetical protein